MAYMVVHIKGNNEVSYPFEKFSELYSELEGAKDEETYVALTHESEWCLSVYSNGLLMWENNFSENNQSWYMENVEEEKVVALWALLANGEIEAIKQQPWLEGNPIYGI